MCLKRTQHCISWLLLSTHVSHRARSLRGPHFKARLVHWTVITLQGVGGQIQVWSVESRGCWWVGGGELSALFPPPPPDIKANFDSGGLWHPGPLSTQETKHRAASLHRIKQSLNASSCYTLPNETFMKGPLMRFQKHLVISPGAAACSSVDIWMNGLLPLQWLTEEQLYECRYLWFYGPICSSHQYRLLFHSLQASAKRSLSLEACGW